MDNQLNQIGHIDFQGTDRQTFTDIGQITQPYSLTVFTGGLLGLLFMTDSYSSAPLLYIHYFKLYVDLFRLLFNLDLMNPDFILNF